MVHMVGIDKGPILDWTDDNGLMECYRKWEVKGGKFSSKVHQTQPMIKLSVTTSFTGLENWNGISRKMGN